MEDGSTHRGIVWIVDDSELDARMAETALGADYLVRRFADGSDLIEELSWNRLPDVLILDRIMPAVSGLDVCAYLRSGPPEHQQLPVLLLTYQGRPEQVAEGLKAGANDYLAKPYSPVELRARVDALIRAVRLQRTARQAEATVQQLLASGPDPTLLIDDSGRVTWANELARSTFAPEGQITGPGLKGRCIRDLLGGLEIGEVLEAAAAPGRTSFDVTVEGHIFAISARKVEAGELSGILLAMRDVTFVRQLDRRRLDFYSVMAHDLRSPLQSTLLRTQMLIRGRRGELSPPLRGDLESIESDCRIMLQLVSDFVELARMEREGYQFDYQEVRLGEIAQEVVSSLQPQVEERQHDVELKLPGVEVTVQGDRARLRQVLANLVSNAIKFTPPGGRIGVRIQASPDEVRVEVEDNGPGIEPELVPRLFERYVRAPDSHHKIEGSGLGLLIVREFVEAHGGSAGVHSQIGEGSTFWIKLPRS